MRTPPEVDDSLTASVVAGKMHSKDASASSRSGAEHEATRGSGAQESSSTIVSSAAVPAALYGPLRCVQHQGVDSVLLFRGLCAAFTDEGAFAADGNSQVCSPLVMPVQHALQTDAFYSMSGFVIVENQLRTRAAARRRSIATRPDLRSLEILGQEVRTDMLNAANRTFEQLVQQLPNVNSADTQSVMEHFHCRSLAYFPTQKPTFENFRFANQQIYSNDDKRFMIAYATVAEEIRTKAPHSEPNIEAWINRHHALLATVKDRERIRYLQLEAWRWMGKRDYLLPRHPLASYLHGNPYLSLTDNLEHALRYSTGQKKYMQGFQQQPANEIPYGWNETLKKWSYEDAWDLPAFAREQWIGVLVMLLVPKEMYEDGIREGFCNNVVQQHANKNIVIKTRIVPEREVTFFGYLPEKTVAKAWPIPMLTLSLDGKMQTLWKKFYNISSPNELRFRDLQKAVTNLVAARVRNQPSSKLLIKVRQAYVSCLKLRIRADIKEKWPHIDVASLVV